MQSTSLKMGYTTTKILQLKAGTYYMAMESANAKKGGSVDYNIAVSEKSSWESDFPAASAVPPVLQDDSSVPEITASAFRLEWDENATSDSSQLTAVSTGDLTDSFGTLTEEKKTGILASL